MRAPVALFPFVAGCLGLNAPREEPWYAEIVFLDAIDLEYDSDGLLYVLYQEEGALGITTIDQGGKDRTSTTRTALEEGGMPVDAAVGNGGTYPDWFNLAIHPKTGTPWLFHRGRVGPIVDRAFEIQVDVNRPENTTGSRGTIEFVDEDTLFVSYEAIDQSDELSQMFEVDGDEVDPSSGEPFMVTSQDSPEQPLWGICDAEVSGGYLFTTQCGGFSHVWEIATGKSVNSETKSVQDNKSSETGTQSQGFVAISDYGAVVSDQTGGDWCALPFDPDRPDVVVQKKSRFDAEGLCRGADAVLPNPVRIDLHPKGKSWAALYQNAGVVLVDEDKPKDASNDVEGAWCGTVSVDGLVGQFELKKGGELVLASQGSEILHNEFKWSYGGDKLTFDFIGYHTYEAEDETFKHWAKRVGDTLIVKSTVDRNSYEHLVDAGYMTLTGLWTPCAS